MAASSAMSVAVLEGVQLTSQNVESAVLQFYQNSASQETHKWLTLAQLSPLAWTFCWDLIQPDKKSFEVVESSRNVCVVQDWFWERLPRLNLPGPLTIC